MPKLTLISTVYNEANGIRDFIESINHQIDMPDEVIIVDGGSSDDTVEIIKNNIHPNIPVQIIVDASCNKKSSKGPIAKGRNVAIAAASHPHIVVTDAGCILDPNWISAMRNSFLDSAVDVVAGWYQARVRNTFQNSISIIFCPPLSSINPKKFLPSSRSIGFKKSAWQLVNGYPETSYTAEDTVFDLRLRSAGFKQVFQPEAIVFWDLPASRAELRKKLILYGEGEGSHGIFFLKYIARLLFIILAPISVFILLACKKKLITYEIYTFQIVGYIRGLLRRK